MIRKIDHINISVTDLEQSKAFYIKVLGFEMLAERVLEGEWIDKTVGLHGVKARYAKLGIPDTETNLELIHYYNPSGEKSEQISKANRIGFRHMAFEVTGIEKIYEKLKAHNIEILSEPQTNDAGKKICYFLGPDGEILELAEYGE